MKMHSHKLYYQFMIIRNYAEQTEKLIQQNVIKTSALIILQYINKKLFIQLTMLYLIPFNELQYLFVDYCIFCTFGKNKNLYLCGIL